MTYALNERVWKPDKLHLLVTQLVRWLANGNGSSRETLKPKSSGYSLRSFFKRVLFPEPEGPAMTSGLGRVRKEEEEEEDLSASVCLEAMSRREEGWIYKD